MGKRILVWFRNDLRLHDNEMLMEALAKSNEILPVYFFDPRHFERTPYHTLKTGVHRTRFLIQSVAALRQSFIQMGGNLMVVVGKPEEVLPALVQQYDLHEVYHHREVASEETTVSTRAEDALWKLQINLRHFIGHTLYNKEDLPFPVKDIPDVFNSFRKKTERDALVKPCFLTPVAANFVQLDDWGEIPLLQDLLSGHFDHHNAPLSDMFVGGEAAALACLVGFLNAGEDMAHAHASVKRSEVASKLSAWLALGCLSPREVYWRLKDAEANYGLKPYFGQITLGILWRDYFRFMFKKYGNTFFRPEGFKQEAESLPLIENKALLLWKTGSTGHEVIDSIMNELNTTGYLSHSSRQLAAIYLVSELKVNWVMGAAYFEEKLVDYCPASNWGNWANIAGVGNDQRLSNSFSLEKQLKAFPKNDSLKPIVTI